MRLRWVLSFIVIDEQNNLIFDEMFDRVFIDEKWFQLEMLKRKLKLFPDSQPEQFRHITHKSHPTQVMSTAAVARPRNLTVDQTSNNRSWEFNGLVGFMHHVNESVAQRNSVNRSAGTPQFVPYNINTENFYEALTMEDGLLDAIDSSFSAYCDPTAIKIQLDNAPGHTGQGMEGKVHTYIASTDKFTNDYHLHYQPPNSPDFNINDLTFFRSLDQQANKLKSQAANDQRYHGIAGLMEVVSLAFEEYNPDKIEAGFGTLFAVFRKVLDHRGGNNFRNPHDHVRDNMNSGNKLNFVHITLIEANALIELVNNFFAGELPNIPLLTYHE